MKPKKTNNQYTIAKSYKEEHKASYKVLEALANRRAKTYDLKNWRTQ